MLTQQHNRLLTETDPGTPLGELFRRHWIPALLAEELPQPDCPPVRVKLLGECMVAFRDTENRIGFIDEFCAHRGVSLFFGRNEECGLRCPYHGWKYDVTGQCVDVPSEREDNNLKNKMKLKGYPGVERGGVIWTYMGPSALQPALPEFEWALLPENHRFISKRLQECNYLQAIEGGLDSSHVSWLHRFSMHTDPLHRGTKGAHYQSDPNPHFEVIESPGGLTIGARRNAEDGHYYWRITPYIMPWYMVVPPYGDNALNGHAWVPIDDEHCWAWVMTYHPVRPLPADEIEAMRNGAGEHVRYVPGTDTPGGSFRPAANRDNGYLIDRAAQKAGKTYSGVEGIAMQDASLQESMGPIQDRAREHLVSTDNAIIMARQRLLKAATALAAGTLEVVPGTDPSCQRVRSASLVLPKDTPFHSGAVDVLEMKSGVAHVGV